MRQPNTGAARATCPCLPPPPACRQRIDSGELTPYHHPTAAAATPSPNLPGLGTGIGDLACNSSRHTHSIPTPSPPRNYQSKSPQMISPLPNIHRLLGLGAGSLVSVREQAAVRQSRGSTCPSPPNSYREEEQEEGGMKRSITATSTPGSSGIPGAQA